MRSSRRFVYTVVPQTSKGDQLYILEGSLWFPWGKDRFAKARQQQMDSECSPGKRVWRPEPWIDMEWVWLWMDCRWVGLLTQICMWRREVSHYPANELDLTSFPLSSPSIPCITLEIQSLIRTSQEARVPRIAYDFVAVPKANSHWLNFLVCVYFCVFHMDFLSFSFSSFLILLLKGNSVLTVASW